MRTYESGAELAAEITKRANLFIDEFAEVPAGNWDLLVEGVDRTPRQMLAYQLGWMELLLGWDWAAFMSLFISVGGRLKPQS